MIENTPCLPGRWGTFMKKFSGVFYLAEDVFFLTSDTPICHLAAGDENQVQSNPLRFFSQTFLGSQTNIAATLECKQRERMQKRIQMGKS